MKQIGDMTLYTFDEVKDEIIGKIGTSERDAYERKVEDEVRAYFEKEAQQKNHLDPPDDVASQENQK
jgi:hypothetical protein